VTQPPEDDLDAWLAFSDENHRGGGARRIWTVPRLVAAGLAVATVVGMVVLRPTGEARRAAQEGLSVLGVPSGFHAAAVADVSDGKCSFSPDLTCTTVTFQLEAGPDAGATLVQEFTAGELTPDFRVGKTAVLSYRPPDGTVLGTKDVTCSFAADLTCSIITVQIGDDIERTAEYEAVKSGPEGFLLPGEPVILSLVEGEAGEVELLGVSPPTLQAQYQFADFQRRHLLTWVALAFAVAVVALGRWRGMAALGGLVASLGIILLFVLPAILDGRSPVWVAAVGASAIAYVALYMAHGFGEKTTVALLGTIGALILTAVLSSLVVAVAELSGFASEESGLLTLFEGIDVRGLVLAGIVLGAAGALDDVTVTQASAIWELSAADPGLEVRDLLQRGLRIGRDHIASTVNTLLLAYAGASLPLLILFVLSSQSLGSIANSEVVAIEIIRTLVGSIGLVAAVPLTTWLAARTAGAARQA